MAEKQIPAITQLGEKVGINVESPQHGLHISGSGIALHVENNSTNNDNIYTPITGRNFDFFSLQCENCKDEELCRRGRCLPKRNINTLKVSKIIQLGLL